MLFLFLHMLNVIDNSKGGEKLRIFVNNCKVINTATNDSILATGGSFTRFVAQSVKIKYTTFVRIIFDKNKIYICISPERITNFHSW